MCEYLLDIVTKMNRKVYYKDMGSLGFPTVSIIIPGISEVVYDIKNINNIRHLFMNDRFIYLYNRLGSISENEVDELINIVNKKNTSSECSIQNILKVPIDIENNHFIDVTLDLFLTMLYVYREKYDEAICSLNRFIIYMKKNDATDDAVEYNEMIVSILKYKKQGFDNDSIVGALKIFFGEDLVQEGIHDIDKNVIFSGLPLCNMSECEKCENYENCFYKEEKRIFNALLSSK